MNKLLELYSKIDEIEKKVSIENTTDNPLVDAYNDGVKALAANVRYCILEKTHTLNNAKVGGDK